MGKCLRASNNTVVDADKANCVSPDMWTPAPAVVAPAEKEDRSYHLLEPIPCYEEEKGVCELNKNTGRLELIAFDPTTDTGNNKLGLYLNIIIRLFIGLCAVAAVVMIVIAGVEYSTAELISSKEAAKERIRNAILGLLLALGSYTILFTINPDLLNTDVDIGGGTITSAGEVTIKDLDNVIKFNNGGGYSGGGGALPKEIAGTICDKNVVTRYARDAGLSITEGQAKTFACLAAAESSCGNNNTSYTNAKGAFQIITSIHKDCINRFSVCQTNGIYNLACNTAVAVCIMKKANGNFRDWTTDYIQKNGTYESHAKQRKCAVDNGQPVGAKCLDIRYKPARPC